MQVGEVWAYRERISDLDCPLVAAEVLQFGPPRSQKVRVRFEGGDYPGLDTWVTQRRLVVLWDEAEAWARDERAFEAARLASLDALGTTEYEAAWMTSYGYGGDDVNLGYGRSEGATVTVADIERTAADLGMGKDDLLREPLSFIDRDGEYVGAWPVP